MMRASFAPLRDRVLGFTPAWESQTQNGWRLWLGKLILTEDEELEFVDDKVFSKRLRSMSRQKYSPIVRHFYRTTTGGDNLSYFGYDFAGSRCFTLKGDYYEFSSRLVGYFMKYKVDSKSDEAALKWINNEDKYQTTN